MWGAPVEPVAAVFPVVPHKEDLLLPNSGIVILNQTLFSAAPLKSVQKQNAAPSCAFAEWRKRHGHIVRRLPSLS